MAGEGQNKHVRHVISNALEQRKLLIVRARRAIGRAGLKGAAERRASSGGRGQRLGGAAAQRGAGGMCVFRRVRAGAAHLSLKGEAATTFSIRACRHAPPRDPKSAHQLVQNTKAGMLMWGPRGWSRTPPRAGGVSAIRLGVRPPLGGHVLQRVDDGLKPYDSAQRGSNKHFKIIIVDAVDKE